STCHVEPGFQCMPQEAPCEMVNGACILRVQAIFRDFAEAHSDFGVGCADPAKNLVQPMLNAQGKPVLVGASQPAVCITSAASFAEWYTDGPNRTTLAGSIVLYANG